MKRIKKAIAVTVVTAILSASGDMTSVLEAGEITDSNIMSETVNSSEGDFEINNGILEKYNGNDTEVIVPDGVKEIALFAFKNCSSLTSIGLPESLEYID